MAGQEIPRKERGQFLYRWPLLPHRCSLHVSDSHLLMLLTNKPGLTPTGPVGASPESTALFIISQVPTAGSGSPAWKSEAGRNQLDSHIPGISRENKTGKPRLTAFIEWLSSGAPQIITSRPRKALLCQLSEIRQRHHPT
ncbi:histone-binding protein RBBP7 [Platysternon megacephalum]|uniref:Histone-binding protein RBBP7 n=1 Tax=Platysternon megacephalum TaxID=55544 RepID=A0A4D9ENM3_9SAUR|nr:histone-binding protein RBBP7 [Platysternon megacephalum]